MALTLSQGDITADRPLPSAAMDEASFQRFYESTARGLRAYLIRACGDPSLADDLLQESYLRYLRAGFDGEDDAHRRNYLFRIASNLMKDHFRRRRPEAHELPEAGAPAAHGSELHMRSDVGAAMAGLSPNDRQMLWLAYVEGASHKEIAGVLGLRAASIRSMLFRARRRLAERLRERGFSGFPGGEGT